MGLPNWGRVIDDNIGNHPAYEEIIYTSAHPAGRINRDRSDGRARRSNNQFLNKKDSRRNDQMKKIYLSKGALIALGVIMLACVGTWSIAPAYICAIFSGIIISVVGLVVIWQNKCIHGLVYVFLGAVVSVTSFIVKNPKSINEYFFTKQLPTNPNSPIGAVKPLIKEDATDSSSKLIEANIITEGNTLDSTIVPAKGAKDKRAEANRKDPTNTDRPRETLRVGVDNPSGERPDTSSVDNSFTKPYQPLKQRTSIGSVKAYINTIICTYHYNDGEDNSESLWNCEGTTRYRLEHAISELEQNRFGTEIINRMEKIKEESVAAMKALDTLKLEILNAEMEQLYNEMAKRELSGDSDFWLDTEQVKSRLDLDDFSLFCYLLGESSLRDSISPNPNIDAFMVAEILFHEIDPRKFVHPLELSSKRYKLLQSEITLKGKHLKEIGDLIDLKKFDDLCRLLLDGWKSPPKKAFTMNVGNVYRAAAELANMKFYIDYSRPLSGKEYPPNLYSFSLFGNFIEGKDWSKSPSELSYMITWSPESGPLFFVSDNFVSDKLKSEPYEKNLGVIQDVLNLKVEIGDVDEKDVPKILEEEKLQFIQQVLNNVMDH